MGTGAYLQKGLKLYPPEIKSIETVMIESYEAVKFMVGHKAFNNYFNSCIVFKITVRAVELLYDSKNKIYKEFGAFAIF